MKRAIVTPAELPASALAELKQWLGITTAQDDALLTDLLRAALDICEAFIGLMPLVQTCQEILTATSGWMTLATKPVVGISGVYQTGNEPNEFTPVGSYGFEADLDADGTGRIRLMVPIDIPRITVRFSAGIAPYWDSLPDALRHGLIRLAAHQHREREGSGASPLPPASVAALWQPWRRMRLT